MELDGRPISPTSTRSCRQLGGISWGRAPVLHGTGFGGWEGTAPTKDHTTEVLRCSEYIQEGTLKLAINAPLQSPRLALRRK